MSQCRNPQHSAQFSKSTPPPAPRSASTTCSFITPSSHAFSNAIQKHNSRHCGKRNRLERGDPMWKKASQSPHHAPVPHCCPSHLPHQHFQHIVMQHWTMLALVCTTSNRNYHPARMTNDRHARLVRRWGLRIVSSSKSSRSASESDAALECRLHCMLKNPMLNRTFQSLDPCSPVWHTKFRVESINSCPSVCSSSVNDFVVVLRFLLLLPFRLPFSTLPHVFLLQIVPLSAPSRT